MAAMSIISKDLSHVFSTFYRKCDRKCDAFGLPTRHDRRIRMQRNLLKIGKRRVSGVQGATGKNEIYDDFISYEIKVSM
jgi:hypothetical protein